MFRPIKPQLRIRINYQIRVKEVRLIGPNGEQIGVISIQDALNRARDVNLDLVEVAPQATPPVCRIMDFGKYKFEKAKREKEARKKQKVIKVKEIKMGPNISEHDYQFKLRHAIEFILEGDKVRLAIVFHGRQITHQELGRKVMARFVEDIKETAIAEQPPRMEGKEFAAIFNLNPLAKKQIKKVAPSKPVVKPEAPETAAPNAAPAPAELASAQPTTVSQSETPSQPNEEEPKPEQPSSSSTPESGSVE